MKRMDKKLQQNISVHTRVGASELEGGDVIWFAPRDFLPWALYSFVMHYAFRIQIGYNVMDILCVRVFTTLRLKP